MRLRACLRARCPPLVPTAIFVNIVRRQESLSWRRTTIDFFTLFCLTKLGFLFGASATSLLGFCTMSATTLALMLGLGIFGSVLLGLLCCVVIRYVPVTFFFQRLFGATHKESDELLAKLRRVVRGNPARIEKIHGLCAKARALLAVETSTPDQRLWCERVISLAETSEDALLLAAECVRKLDDASVGTEEKARLRVHVPKCVWLVCEIRHFFAETCAACFVHDDVDVFFPSE